MAKNEEYNVYSILTGEPLKQSPRVGELPQQLEIINMLNQRKHQMKDIIFIWTERDDDCDPKFLSTTMTSVQRLGMLHHVAGIINSLAYDDDSVEEDEDDG